MEFGSNTPALLILCGLACAAIANSDNRSPLGFFLLGIIAPPIALFVLAVTRKDENHRTIFVDIINGRRAKKPNRKDWMGSIFALTMGLLVFGTLFYFS